VLRPSESEIAFRTPAAVTTAIDRPSGENMHDVIAAAHRRRVVLIERPADVRVIERREHLRFTSEPRQPIRIEREGVRQNLQRDVAIELAVARTIDLAHAACAEGRQNFIGTEARAGNERHAEEVTRFYFAMCARSFSFSLQTYSRMSVSACNRCVTFTVNGLL